MLVLDGMALSFFHLKTITNNGEYKIHIYRIQKIICEESSLFFLLSPSPQLFHSVLDGYDSVSSAGLSLLGAGGRGLLSWRPGWTITGPSNTVSSLVFHASFAVFRLVLLWLITSVLLRNYRRARAELYRPAVDLQDYEMVELFLRRLKMWMGLSRAKEVRVLVQIYDKLSGKKHYFLETGTKYETSIFFLYYWLGTVGS